jgi:hypothetical protein
LLRGAEDGAALARAVAGRARARDRRCRVARRKAAPSTLDRWTDLDPDFDQTHEGAPEAAER